MFVLSAVAVFLCVKMMGCFFSPNNMDATFKASSQARFLRAQVQARGSHTWGF
tara:strand:- start:579 stop:737 length:159 start_codon:yes stop_codon:yes gene_type:complete